MTKKELALLLFFIEIFLVLVVWSLGVLFNFKSTVSVWLEGIGIVILLIAVFKTGRSYQKHRRSY